MYCVFHHIPGHLPRQIWFWKFSTKTWALVFVFLLWWSWYICNLRTKKISIQNITWTIIIFKKCDMHIWAPYVLNRHPICNNTSIVATNLIYTALTDIYNSLFPYVSSSQKTIKRHKIRATTRYVQFSDPSLKYQRNFWVQMFTFWVIGCIPILMSRSRLDLCEIETNFISFDQSWSSTSKRTYSASLKLNLSLRNEQAWQSSMRHGRPKVQVLNTMHFQHDQIFS